MWHKKYFRNLKIIPKESTNMQNKVMHLMYFKSINYIFRIVTEIDLYRGFNDKESKSYIRWKGDVKQSIRIYYSPLLWTTNALAWVWETLWIDIRIAIVVKILIYSFVKEVDFINIFIPLFLFLTNYPYKICILSLFNCLIIITLLLIKNLKF
jgi:hypothetical protein